MGIQKLINSSEFSELWALLNEVWPEILNLYRTTEYISQVETRELSIPCISFWIENGLDLLSIINHSPIKRISGKMAQSSYFVIWTVKLRRCSFLTIFCVVSEQIIVFLLFLSVFVTVYFLFFVVKLNLYFIF